MTDSTALKFSNTRSFDHEADAADAAFFQDAWGTHRPKPAQRILIELARRTFLQRGRLRHWITNLITGMGRPLDVNFRGCRFRIEGRNNLIEYGLLTRPTYNGMEIDFLSEVVKDGGTAIDIGSNVGLYSLTLAKAAGPQGCVLAIDANPVMVRHLEFNAEASGLDTVIGLNRAVGDRDDWVDLKIRQDDVAIVSVVKSDSGAIRMQSLEQIVREAGLTRVDALKIDIEGHEDQALVPYLKSVPERLLPKRIVIEQFRRGQDYPGCAAEFARLGYRLRGRSKINSLYERDIG